MVYYKKKVEGVKYDIQKLKNALIFLKEKFATVSNEYGMTQETASNMIELIQEVIDSAQSQEIEVDASRRETEEEAKAYFGQEFIAQFEEIRKMCQEQGTTLAIHGTDIDCAKNIQEQGLRYKRPQLLSTTVIQRSTEEQPEYKNYSELLNWTHRDYKGLVLVGIPNECVGEYSTEGDDGAKPLWQYTPSDTHTEYDQDYAIKPEFIIGYIDVENNAIVNNELYTHEHDYTGLVHDEEINHETNDEKVESVENVGTNITEKQLTPKELIVGETGNISGALSNLLKCVNMMVPEDEVASFLSKLRESQQIIASAIPGLESNKVVDERLEAQRRSDEEYDAKLASGELEADSAEWGEGWDWEEEIDDEISEIFTSDFNLATLELIEHEQEIGKDIPPEV